jgi:hypothetical protein
MLQIDYTAPASITWQHPPYGKTAPEEHCDEFNLGEAIRFVMEDLQPEHRVQAKISAGGMDYRIDDIGGIYHRPDFPRG